MQKQQNKRNISGSISTRRNNRILASQDTVIGSSGQQGSLKSHYNGIKNKKVNADFQFDFDGGFQNITDLKNGSYENKDPNQLQKIKKSSKNGDVFTQSSSQTTQINSQLSQSTQNLLSKYVKNQAGNDKTQSNAIVKVIEEDPIAEASDGTTSADALISKKPSPIRQKPVETRNSTKKRKLKDLSGDNQIDDKRQIKKFKDQNDEGKLVISDNLVQINSSKSQKRKDKTDQNVTIGAVKNDQVLAGLSDSTKGLVSKLMMGKKAPETQLNRSKDQLKIVVDKKTLLTESDQKQSDDEQNTPEFAIRRSDGSEKFSYQTQQIINNLKNKRESGQGKNDYKSPLRITKNAEGKSSELSMREKHQELLSIQRKLVIPEKYKPLMTMAAHIDSTINMLKSRVRNSSIIRNEADQATITSNFVSFKEIQKSIAGSLAKTLTKGMFRQILTIAPDMYQHAWQWMNKISVTEPQLMIDFNNVFNTKTSKEQLRQQDQVKRQQHIEQEIIKITKEAHDQFIDELEKTEEVKDIFRDPLSTQQWYHKFNPHTSPYIKDILLAQLHAYPEHKQQHTSSIKDFMVVQKPGQTGRQSRSRGRSPSIAHEAIRNASKDSTTGIGSPRSGNMSPSKRNSQILTRRSKVKELLLTPEDKALQVKKREDEDKKLQEMCAKYGISAQTLRLVQDKQAIDDKKKSDNQAQTAATMDEKKFQEFSKLQEGIRQQFMSRGKVSMNIQELSSSLVQNRSMNQQFMSKGQVFTAIIQLAKIVPEFIEVKSIMVKGRQEKFIKLQKKISAGHQMQQYQQSLTGLQVNQLIRERLQLDKEQ